MDRKVRFTLVCAGAVVAAATVAAGISYATSAARNRWNTRLARRLGIKPAAFGVSYSSTEVLDHLEQAEFTGGLHLRLVMMPDEERVKALENFNASRREKDLEPISDDHIVEFTEAFRLAVVERLTSAERSEVLAMFNTLRAKMDLKPITDDLRR